MILFPPPYMFFDIETGLYLQPAPEALDYSMVWTWKNDVRREIVGVNIWRKYVSAKYICILRASPNK